MYTSQSNPFSIIEFNILKMFFKHISYIFRKNISGKIDHFDGVKLKYTG